MTEQKKKESSGTRTETRSRSPVEGTIKIKGQEHKTEDKSDRHVSWTEETIDNENLGKKKSNSTKFGFIYPSLLICSLLYISQAGC